MNSKKKGNRGERQAVSFMKEWSGKDFARTPQSGGLHWHTKNTTGDIVCLEEGYVFPMSIEVKFPKEIDLLKQLYNVNSKIDEYWDQCQHDAVIHKKLPFLMVRKNGMPKAFFMVFLPANMVSILRKEVKIPKPYLYISARYLVLTTESLAKINYRTFEKLTKRWLKRVYPNG